MTPEEHLAFLREAELAEKPLKILAFWATSPNPTVRSARVA